MTRRELPRDAFDVAAGVRTYHTYDHLTKETTIEVVQDASPFLRVTEAERNDAVGGARGLTDKDRKQIKDGHWHYARIPIGVQYEWLQKYGVQLGKPEHEKKIMQLLNTEYQHLKTTYGTHTIK